MSHAAVIPKNRDNSFNATRVLAAAGVIISHHFPISGFDEPRFLGLSLGTLSLYIFFLMSGFLICRSIMNNPDFFRFVSARLLRIVPNLFCALVVTSLVTMIFYSNYPNWFEHMRFIAQNLAMLIRGGPFYNVSGIFQNRPMQALNGSLWSLPYEVWCYFILFAILKFTTQNYKPAIFAAIFFGIMSWILPDMRLYPSAISIQPLGHLGLWFFVGAAFACYNRSIPVLSSPALSSFGKWGDPSYGMYIFAFPVQQFCALLIPNFIVSMGAALTISTAIGYATWHGFEKKALRKVGPFAVWLRSRFTWGQG